MKIRSGFVSNSSSSSFIMFLDKMPDCTDDVYEMMDLDPEDTSKVLATGWGADDYLMAIDVTASLLQEIKEEGIASLEDVATKLQCEVHWEMYQLSEHYVHGRESMLFHDTSYLELPKVFHEFAKREKIVHEIVSEKRDKLLPGGIAGAKKDGLSEDERRKRYYEIREFEKEQDKLHNVDYENQHILIDNEAMDRAKKLIAKNTGKIPVIVSYADEDGTFGAMMEHQGVLEKYLSAICISHH